MLFTVTFVLIGGNMKYLKIKLLRPKKKIHTLND